METTTATTNGESTAQQQVAAVSLSRRLWWELRPSFGLFSPLEPTGRTVDLAACFSGAGGTRTRCYSCLLRLLLWLWAVQVLAVDVCHYPPHNLYIYLGYLTHWGHLLSIGYLLGSFLCAAVPALIQRNNHKNDINDDEQQQQPTEQRQPPPQIPLRLIQTTWFLYSLTAPLELAICLLYWSAVAAGPAAFSYVSVMEHGGIAIAVWLDGTGVLAASKTGGGSGVPVRAKHAAFLMVTCCAYLFWTGVDAVLGIGNGEWGPAYSDDALYPVLNWNSDKQLAATVSAVAICGVAPACFALCWLASLYSGAGGGCGRRTADGGRCCSAASFDGSRRPLLPPLDRVVDDAVEAADYKVLDDAPIV